MKSGLIVVGVTLVVGTVVGLLAAQRVNQRVVAVEDLFTALAYFAETHDGRLPLSAEELADSAFVERRPDGTLVVLPRPESATGRQPYGAALRDLRQYEIAWGVDLHTLTIDETGVARGPEGAAVLIVGSGAYPDGLAQFTRDLIRYARGDQATVPPESPDPGAPQE